MQEILKSTLLEYEKSTFLIDLIKHNSGVNYIKVRQTIEGNNDSQELKINLSVVTDLISVLQNYQNRIPEQFSKPKTLKPKKPYFSEDKQQVIVNRYFKGLTIETLALQFDCTIQIIEPILMNKQIPIVDNKLPKLYKYFKYRKRK
ncbi:MAG: hypothetical protein V5804_00815 [Mucilaginibacter sp.]|uniref:hypothetical protein n=1 Tax=Mucilaginibacter sp. TaxID=1882438 RepID=UPI0034E3B872